MDYIVTYGGEQKGCLVCGEEFDVVWNARINDWVLKNTLMVKLMDGDKPVEEKCIMHPECYSVLAVQDKAPKEKLKLEDSGKKRGEPLGIPQTVKPTTNLNHVRSTVTTNS